ncbi:TMEM164 family-domain-containing protein [Blastocladiella britannica]|nr:TMEM164 family-domain-containing protein [Blastocladiella britannica]
MLGSQSGRRILFQQGLKSIQSLFLELNSLVWRKTITSKMLFLVAAAQSAADSISAPFLYLDEVVVAAAARFLQRTSPLSHAGSPAEADYFGFWFLTPRQHVYEFIGINALFLAALPVIRAVYRRRSDIAAHLPSSRGLSRRASVLTLTASQGLHNLNAHLAQSLDHARESMHQSVGHARDTLHGASEAVRSRAHEAAESLTAALDEASRRAAASSMDLATALGVSEDTPGPADTDNDESDSDSGDIALSREQPWSDVDPEYVSPTDIAAAHPTVPRLLRAGVPALLLLASWAITFEQKWQQGSLFFMLQPCHMSALILACLLAMPRAWRPRDLLLNMFFPSQWGAVLALAMPDLRTHTTPLHVFNFVAEHVLLLTVPVYAARVGEFRVIPRRSIVCALSLIAMGLYHSALLAILGVISGVNLNYVLVMPPGPLEALGKWYRVAMFVAGGVLTAGMRFGLWEASLWIANKISLGRGKHDHKKVE